ncbi:MAG: hypothetical protein QGG67_18510, partial [Gammaproteobacteria bacterium]|nr:hypothetical protein [Gammaproteobacteria bacterium]
LCVYRELSSRHFLSFSSSFPLGINDEPKVSLMQSGDYVQLGLTGYTRLIQPGKTIFSATLKTHFTI